MYDKMILFSVWLFRDLYRVQSLHHSFPNMRSIYLFFFYFLNMTINLIMCTCDTFWSSLNISQNHSFAERLAVTYRKKNLVRLNQKILYVWKEWIIIPADGERIVRKTRFDSFWHRYYSFWFDHYNWVVSSWPCKDMPW